MILLLVIMALFASLSLLCALATLIAISLWQAPRRPHARPVIVRPLRIVLAEPENDQKS